MTSRQQVVWLFRSGEEQDPYEESLTEAGFEGRTVPVLSFERANTSELRIALEHPKSYDGLIFTSPRAVEAFTEAMPWLPSENIVWHTKAVFAAGPRTAEELRRIGFEPEGEESGSARMLARYIAKREFERPLLFLCGDRRRDDLPNLLQNGGVAVEELCVYTSRPKTVLDVNHLPRPDWVVFFSPSGIEAVRSTSLELDDVRVAAIGSTTASALQQAGYSVDAVADEPSPEGITAAILTAAEG